MLVNGECSFLIIKSVIAVCLGQDKGILHGDVSVHKFISSQINSSPECEVNDTETKLVLCHLNVGNPF